MANKSDTLYCSFCGKNQHEVIKLIAGPTVFICDECVVLCMDILREESKDREAFAKKELERNPGLGGTLQLATDSFAEIIEKRAKDLEVLEGYVKNHKKESEPYLMLQAALEKILEALPGEKAARPGSTEPIPLKPAAGGGFGGEG